MHVLAGVGRTCDRPARSTNRRVEAAGRLSQFLGRLAQHARLFVESAAEVPRRYRGVAARCRRYCPSIQRKARIRSICAMVQRRSRARAGTAAGYLERFRLSSRAGAFEIGEPRQQHPRGGVPGKHDYCIREPGPFWLNGRRARFETSRRACLRYAQKQKSLSQTWLSTPSEIGTAIPYNL